MNGIDRCDEPTCSAWAEVVVPHGEDRHSKLCEMHGNGFSHNEKVDIEEWVDGVRLSDSGGRVQTDAGQPENVVGQLKERLQEVSKEKQERIEKGDDVGMAYRAGKEMGLIYAIETVEECSVNSGVEE